MVRRKLLGILGANGFIGNNLCCDLSHNFDCVGITKEKFDSEKNKEYDVFINANGNSNKRLSSTDPLLDFDLTVRNTLRSITEYKYDLYVHISSCEVYSNISDINSTKEDSVIDVSKISKYALSKYFSECLVRNHCRKWIILRLSTPIGEGLKKGPVYDILKSDKIWMSAESRLQFMHTSFISKFISDIIDQGITNEIINLVGNHSVSLLEVMNKLNKVVEYPNEPIITHNIDNFKANKILKVPHSLEAISESL